MRTKVAAVTAAILTATALGGIGTANAAPASQTKAVSPTGTALHAGAAPYGGTARHADAGHHADAAPHSEAIRYASVRGCTDKHEVRYPCGRWRLVTHGGERRELPDARTTPVDGKGRPRKYSVAPIEVSGDGLHVAYFRKSDGRLVVREIGGQVRAMAGVLPARVGMDDVTLILSQDGARLAVVLPEARKLHSRVYDTANGALLWTVPWNRVLLGFSADDDELLTHSETTDTVLRVLGPSGERLRGRTLDVDEGVYAPYGLAADGTTVVTAQEKHGRWDVVVHDLASGRVLTRVPVGKNPPETLAWTGPEEVTAHFVTYGGNVNGIRPTRVRVVRIDTATGKSRVRESYKVLSDTMSFAGCGG
ncbi:YncE family protein [Streptosporangium sp. NPDC004379]|uniref:YncE family protein n=1 Tax=Streptosporangium sp. NPDC004379 TaxID=3366189 RepID=UPI0036BB0092